MATVMVTEIEWDIETDDGAPVPELPESMTLDVADEALDDLDDLNLALDMEICDQLSDLTGFCVLGFNRHLIH